MRSSVHPHPPTTVARPLPVPKERLRLPLAIAKLAGLVGVIVTCLWFGLPQSLGGRADWVMVSGTSMLPRLHTGDADGSLSHWCRGRALARSVPRRT